MPARAGRVFAVPARLRMRPLNFPIHEFFFNLLNLGLVKLLFDVNVAAGGIVLWVAGVFVPRLAARHAFPRILHIVARCFDLFVFVAWSADRHALRAVITTVLCTRASGIHRESQRPQKAEAGTAGNEE